MSEATRGQQNRKEIRQQMEFNLAKYFPDTLDRASNRIAYDFHLSPYTVRYTYLPMFIDVGILASCGNGKYDLSAKAQQAQAEKQKAEAENFSKISEAREQLTNTIKTAILENSKMSLADAVEKFSSKDVDEDEVAHCYDIAKNRIELEKQRKRVTP